MSDGRNTMTEHHFPDKVNIQEFLDIISNEDDLKGFKTNLDQLYPDKFEYPESWMQTFIGWMELNK